MVVVQDTVHTFHLLRLESLVLLVFFGRLLLRLFVVDGIRSRCITSSQSSPRKYVTFWDEFTSLA